MIHLLCVLYCVHYQLNCVHRLRRKLLVICTSWVCKAREKLGARLLNTVYARVLRNYIQYGQRLGFAAMCVCSGM